MDDTTWYGNQSDAQGLALGALAVIEPMIQNINLVEIINRHLPADPQAEFDHGTILAMLAAARLYSPVALSNVADWAEASGAELLWDIPAEKLNDDRLGRSLDALFTQRHSIQASLALHVAQAFGISLDRLHYDPTHILFTGAYAGAVAREELTDDEVRSDDARGAAQINKGRATDDAPQGSRMVHVGLLSYIDELGVLPLFGHTIDGNQNGRTGIREQLALVGKLLKPPEFTMISDRGTFSVAHLLRLKEVKSHAICSVPWGDVKELFAAHRKSLNWKDATYLSIEQQRRRDCNSELPLESYSLAVLNHTMTDDASKESIAVRVMFVFSSADQKVVQQQRQKKIASVTMEFQQLEKSVAAGRYNDKRETAVARRVARAFGSGTIDRYFTWSLVKLTSAQQKQLPKPERGCRIPTHRFDWKFDPERVSDDETSDGFSAIVTTTPKTKYSCDQLFTMFREQNLVEHANRQLKGPLAVRPIFLHTPERVEALLFVLMMALMIYFLIQRTYREQTDDDAPQSEHRTTTATILKSFLNYTVLIHHHPGGREVQPTRLTSRQRGYLRRLQFPTPAQTLSRRLARPPD